MTETTAAASEPAPAAAVASDLSGYSANVYEMRLVPFDLKSFVFLAIATALPIIPVVLLSAPIDVLLKAVARYIF